MLEIHALHPDPLLTPTYRAMFAAFMNPYFEGDDATALFDMRRDGARLQFEGRFQMAYAELLTTPAGQPLAMFLVSVELARWAERTFQDERLEFEKNDDEDRSWRDGC